jgi:hypothetical protein
MIDIIKREERGRGKIGESEKNSPWTYREVLILIGGAGLVLS